VFVVIDYGALAPEINSARMYAGPGPGSLVAAGALWNNLAAELHNAASSYRTVIEGLITTRWMGPASLSMASAFGPYVAWTAGAAARAAETASQASLAVEVYETAFSMTVPPPAVAANRVRLASLTATNLLGQNTTAIAATETEYGEMWAQDAAAMYSYAAGSVEASNLTTFTPPPEVANPAGLAAQTAQTTGTSIGAGVQSTLAHLVSAVPTALQSLASPTASATSTGLGGLLSSSGFSVGSLATSLISEFADLAGFAVIFTGLDALAPLFNPAVWVPFMNMGAAAAAPLAEGAAAAAAPAALGSGIAGGLGGLTGLGQAAAVGGLSVPPMWGWAAAAPAGMLGGVPLALPGLGAPGGIPLAAGVPLMMGGLPRSAAAGAVGGAVAAKYGPRLTAVSRSPAAGYAPDRQSPPAVAYPVPPGVAPPAPGYMPAIVYLPTNGHSHAEV
jgi:PPE-repeat protein